MSLALFDDTPAFPTFDLGPHRRAEYEELPETPRCELIFGRFYVSPSPTPLHQTVASLLWQLLRALGRPVKARAFPAPLDTVLADYSVVQPDVIYLSAQKRGLVRDRIEGVPDLVVEVISPRSARLDRGEKLRGYAESGVQEYWITDPVGRQIEFLVLREGQYVVVLPEGPLYRSPVLPEIQFDLEAFWREVDEELALDA